MSSRSSRRRPPTATACFDRSSYYRHPGETEETSIMNIRTEEEAVAAYKSGSKVSWPASATTTSSSTSMGPCTPTSTPRIMPIGPPRILAWMSCCRCGLTRSATLTRNPLGNTSNVGMNQTASSPWCNRASTANVAGRVPSIDARPVRAGAREAERSSLIEQGIAADRPISGWRLRRLPLATPPELRHPYPPPETISWECQGLVCNRMLLAKAHGACASNGGENPGRVRAIVTRVALALL